MIALENFICQHQPNVILILNIMFIRTMPVIYYLDKHEMSSLLLFL